MPTSPRKRLELINTIDHPRNPPAELKMDVLRRCFEQVGNIKSVSEEIGYSRASIYNWHKKYLREGAHALVNKKNIPVDVLLEEKPESHSEDVEQPRQQVFNLQLEVDILKETINVLKKRPRSRLDDPTLKNREKAVMIDALKCRFTADAA